ncbi:MAG: TolC family protein [Bacteroidales bacterium]|nr:TolC family protein [Bacteroidales bacterium]
MKHKRLTALLLLTACLGLAKAQDTVLTLSVKDAEQYALNHNKELQNATLDVRKAEAVRWQTLGTMLPQVKAGFDYSNFCGYEMEMRMGPAGITIPMNPYGTLSLTASIAITGAQIVGTQLGTLSKQMADISLKQSEKNTIKNVRSVYLSILVMEKTLALLDSSLQNIMSLEKTAQNAVKVGASEQVEADQIAIQVNSMRNNINASKRTLELLYNSMIVQIGADVNTKIVLTGNLDEILDIGNMNGLLGEDFDIRNNYNYQLLEMSEKLSKKQVLMAWMNYLPTLSVFYQYSSKTYFGKDEGMNMTPPNMVGASLSLPIFSSGVNAAKVREAKINLQETRNTVENGRNGLLVQERQLRYNLVSAYENYLNQNDNIEVSQRVFKNILNKYKVGMSSSLDVTNSSNNLITAQSNYIQSVMELVNAKIELENLLNIDIK